MKQRDPGRTGTDLRRSFERAWRKPGAGADAAKARLDGEAVCVVRRDLEVRTQTWASAPESLPAIRTEIMDGIDRLVFYRAYLELSPDTRNAVRERLGELPLETASVERQIAADELRVLVLREWARLHFGDYARGDWFDAYRHAARLRSNGMRRNLERLVGEAPDTAFAHRDAAAYGLNTALRLRLLRAPRGRPIARHGLIVRLRRLFGRPYDEKFVRSDEARG